MNKPKLAKYKQCTGCGACVASCNHHALSIDYDKNGFLHPIIDTEKCIGCGLCERKCHVLQQENLSFHDAMNMRSYTVWTKDDELCKNAASGGVFAQFALHFLDRGNASVYGAMLSDHNTCAHIRVTDKAELHKIIGTKYIQSDASPIYKSVKEDLKGGRDVLFSGTPCQVASLYTYLGYKNVEKLLTLELICHGTPSKVATDLACAYYGADHIVAYRNKLEGWCLQPFRRVCFRSIYMLRKQTRECSLSQILDSKEDIIVAKGRKDAFYRIWGHMAAESCCTCLYAKPDRVADLTLGDQWGMAREMPDRQKIGASLVLVNTAKGLSAINDVEEFFVREESNKKLNAPNLFHPTLHALSFSRHIGLINKLPKKLAFTVFALDWRHNWLMLPLAIYRMFREKRCKSMGKLMTESTKKKYNWL